tara:strand:- start:2019 stop:2660 length:642 start_codon:yes stop_codon:yes gene_type:complete
MNCINCKSFKLIELNGQKVCTECGLVSKYQEHMYSTFDTSVQSSISPEHLQNVESVCDVLQLNNSEFEILRDSFEYGPKFSQRDETISKMAGIVHQQFPRFSLQSLETTLKVPANKITKYAELFDCNYTRFDKLKATYLQYGEILNFKRQVLYKHLHLIKNLIRIKASDNYVVLVCFHLYFDVPYYLLNKKFKNCSKKTFLKCLTLVSSDLTL